jgi:hypothetical protein
MNGQHCSALKPAFDASLSAGFVLCWCWKKSGFQQVVLGSAGCARCFRPDQFCKRHLAIAPGRSFKGWVMVREVRQPNTPSTPKAQDERSANILAKRIHGIHLMSQESEMSMYVEQKNLCRELTFVGRVSVAGYCSHLTRFTLIGVELNEMAAHLTSVFETVPA